MLLFKGFLLVLSWYTIIVLAKEKWLRPGCHKVGNTRMISIPQCIEFPITMNACRGFCESYALPWTVWTRSTVDSLFKSIKPVVSVGQCCNMMESVEVFVYIYENLPNTQTLYEGITFCLSMRQCLFRLPYFLSGKHVKLIRMLHFKDKCKNQIRKPVLCLNGMQNFTFKSAVSCGCYHCKKD